MGEVALFMKILLSVNLGNYGSTGHIMKNIFAHAEENGYKTYQAYRKGINSFSLIERDIILFRVNTFRFNRLLSKCAEYNGCFSVAVWRLVNEKGDLKMTNNIYPAIVAVGYNRPDCLTRLLKSIERANYPNENITLVVSLDHSDKTEELIKIAHDIGWSHGKLVIRTFDEKQGLRKHIIQCGDLSEQYGAVIILEDDLVVSRCFYNYVVQTLCFYGDNPKIIGVSLYSHAWNGYANYEFRPQRNEYDTYLGQFSITWGQCWTKKQWRGFKEWYETKEKVGLTTNTKLPESIEHWGDKSWGKYFVYYLVEKNLYYIIPYISLSTNCSEIGEHNTVVSSTHQVMLLDADNMEFCFPTIEQAIKYDVFFERIFDDDFSIAEIKAKDICIDLNGKHRDANGRQYLLTSEKQKDLKPIRTFGIQLRPIEENIIADIEGEEFFLYQVTTSFRKKADTTFPSAARMKYELYDNLWKRTILYGLRGFRNALHRRLIGRNK